ncbi:MAG TPA: hypothetical protein VN397_05030 [Candidatus Methylomirabilis sp.]|nr:hypothetical protein [Candidatus Methylomirabilis sp.]
MRRWMVYAGMCLVGTACGLDEEGLAFDNDASPEDALADTPGDPHEASWPDGGTDASDAPPEAMGDQDAPDVTDGDVDDASDAFNDASDAGDAVVADVAEDVNDASSDVVVTDAGCQSTGGGPQGFRFKWYSAANWHQTRLDAEIDKPPLGSPDVPWTQAICTDADPAWNAWDCFITITSLPCGSVVRLNVLIDDGTPSGTLMCNTQGCLGFPGEYAAWNDGKLIPVPAFAEVETIQPCDGGLCLHRLKLTIP